MEGIKRKEKRVIGRRSVSNISFLVFNYGLLTLLTLACLYPILHIVFASFSEPTALMAHNGIPITRS